jgi:hypothetical protein
MLSTFLVVMVSQVYVKGVLIKQVQVLYRKAKSILYLITHF